MEITDTQVENQNFKQIIKSFTYNPSQKYFTRLL